MKFQRLILLFCLFVVPTLSAQTLLDGRVADTLGQALPNINVLVYEAGQNTIKAYGISNAEGRFEIAVNTQADSLDVKVNSAFFEKKSLRVANRSQSMRFVLRDEVQLLKGVTVRARSIEQKTDTLQYIVGSFVQKQDKSIEDVLKRMPGIEVEDDGKITYQGLPIQKFYVEGMDLMGGNYNAVSKNLPHQSVSSVEIYENHQPVKMLEDRVTSRQASLNIKLAKDVAVAGTAKVGLGGWPFLWDVNFTPMLFSDKVQTLVAYRGNNSGDDITLYTRWLLSEDERNDRPSRLGEELGVKAAATPLFNSRRYLDNQTHLLNLNTLVPAGKNSSLRVNLYYLNDLQKQSVSQRNTLFLSGDTLCYTEQIDNRCRDNVMYGTVNLNRNEKGFYLDEKFNFSRSWDDAYGLLVNNGNPVVQNLALPAFSIDNDLRIILPIGKRMLDFTSYVGYGRTPHRLGVEPGPFSYFLNDSLPYSCLNQDLDSRQFFADHALSGLFTVGRFVIKPKVGFCFVDSQSDARLSLSNDGVDDWAAFPELTALRRNVKSYAILGIEYKLKRFSAGIDLPVALQCLSVADENDNGDAMTRVLFDPYLWSRYKAGDFWTFSASGGLSHSIGNFDNWLNGYLLTDYQQLMFRSAPLSMSRLVTGSLNAEFKQPFLSLSGNLRYSVSQQHSDNLYRYEVGEGGVTMMRVIEQANDRRYQTLRGDVKKYFSSIRTTIGLKGSLLESRGIALVNDALMNTQTLSYSLSPSMMFKATNWLNVDYSLNYNKMYSFIDAQRRSDISYWRHFGKAYAFLKRGQTLTLMAEYYYHQGEPYLFVDASYEISIKKPKLDFALNWNNIFNNKRYVSFYSGAFSVQETIYNLRPMSVVASVRFGF